MQKVNNIVTSLLLAVSLVAVIAVAVVVMNAKPTGAQDGAPSPTPPASVSIQSAGAIEVHQPSLG